MKLRLDELRRALGASAFELWQRLAAAADRRGVVRMTRSEMGRNGDGFAELTDRQVAKALLRLRAAGLVSNVASRWDASRTVAGRALSAETADVPPATWRWTRGTAGWGGRRPGAGRARGGRPPREPEESSGTATPNQAGPLPGATMQDDSGSRGGDRDPSRSLLKPPRKSRGTAIQNQEGPQPHRLGSDPKKILSPSLRSVDRMPARGGAGLDLDLPGEGERPALLVDLGDGAPELEDGCPPRGVAELLRLPGVPGMHLEDGRRAELAIRSPFAPEAKVLDAGVVLDHVARLFRETTEVVFGERDLRMNGVASSRGKSKLADPVLEWWRACAEKDVRPAEWLLWELEGWRDRHPGTKVQIVGVLSSRRVRDGKIRRFFRLGGPRLGGRVAFDPVGRAYAQKVQALERAVDRLVVAKLGRVSDEEVLEAVREIFPRGADNAAEILVEVHRRTTAETTRLAELADLGSFVWRDEQ